MASNDWWYIKDGSKFGPVSVDELERRLISDEVTPDTLVWCEGMDGWSKMKEVRALANSLKKSPPPLQCIEPTPPNLDKASYSRGDSTADEDKKEKKDNFFVRYWRGQITLPLSYWLVSSGSTVAVLTFVYAISGALEKFKISSPLASFASFSSIALLCLVVTVWQLVGVWRSAGNYILEKPGRKRWGYIARVMVILGSLKAVQQFAEYVPTVSELSRVAFQGDPSIPDYNITVTQSGKEIKVSGGLKFGITTDLEKIVTATPTATTIDLESEGGRISEAAELYELILRHNLNTVSNDTCLSACTIAFAAGAKRTLGLGAKLGFHSASFPGLSERDVNAQSETIEKRIQQRNGTPRAFFTRASSVSHEKMWYPDRSELFKNHYITSTRLEAESSAEIVANVLQPDLDKQKKELPKKIDEYTTQIGVKTDGSVVYYIYAINSKAASVYRKDSEAVQSVKQELTKTACESVGKFIKAGLSYAYVYLEPPDKQPIIFVQVNECS